MLNPFRYGNPVPPDRFFGRAEAVRTIFSRIANHESTAVIGEPHIGKSSVLRYISSARVRQAFDFDDSRTLVHSFDAHLAGEQASPADFWRDLTDALEARWAEPEIQRSVSRARESTFRSSPLAALFNAIAAEERQVVLAIDEFDSLLGRPAFNTVDFFGLLRSLSTRTDALAVVMASRLSVSELNRRTQAMNPTGSPLFNNYIEVRLRPLSHMEVHRLLDGVLDGSKISYSPQDREFVIRISGCHPFLVQVAGAALFDAKCCGGSIEEQYRSAGSVVCERSRPYFDDLWRHLEARAQIAMVALALSEFGSRQAGREFDTAEFERVEWYGPELRRLAEIGLVANDESPGASAGWRVSAGAFVPWLNEDVIPGTRDVVDFEKWVREREFDGMLTRKQLAQFKSVAGAVPKGVVTWAGSFVGELLKSWVKGKAV